MATALGRLLILYLNGRGAGRFQLDDRSLDLKRFAEARISIDDERQRAGPRRIGRLLGQLREGEQPDVRQAEDSRRERRPGQVNRLVAAALDEPGEEGTRSAGNLDSGVGDERAEVFAGRGHLSLVTGH